MQELTQQDYLKIKATIDAYQTKFFLRKKDLPADGVWENACKKYIELCNNDPEWSKLRDLVREYQNLANFDMEKYFVINHKLRTAIIGNTHITNRFQIRQLENSHSVIQTRNENAIQLQKWIDVGLDNKELTKYFTEQTYLKEQHQKYQNTYEHFDEYSQDINEKIKLLDSKRFAIGKKTRINHLKNKLQQLETIANDYSELLEKQNISEQYKKTNDYFNYSDNMKRLERISEKHANEVIIEVLKNRPEMIRMLDFHQKELDQKMCVGLFTEKYPHAEILYDTLKQFKQAALNMTTENTEEISY